LAVLPAFSLLLLASSRLDSSLASLRLPLWNSLRFFRKASSFRFSNARESSAESLHRSRTEWIGWRMFDAGCRGPWPRAIPNRRRHGHGLYERNQDEHRVFGNSEKPSIRWGVSAGVSSGVRKLPDSSTECV